MKQPSVSPKDVVCHCPASVCMYAGQLAECMPFYEAGLSSPIDWRPDWRHTFPWSLRQCLRRHLGGAAVASFPPAELPAFTGTTKPSDSLVIFAVLPLQL